MGRTQTVLEAAGREVVITNSARCFSQIGEGKASKENETKTTGDVASNPGITR